MTLARFATRLATATMEDSVQDAARTMRDRRVGCLVITLGGRPAGIVTDRDLVVRVMAEGRDPSTTRIRDFVTYDPITVSVHDGIETAVERMRRHGARRLPLVNEEGVAVGIVTTDDLFVLLGGQIATLSEGIAESADADDSR
jgi:CBS domain-containing protein